MKKIKTRDGQETIVDDDIAEALKGKTVWISSGGYAQVTIDGKRKAVHHLVVGKKRGLEVDHRNRNKLDNRRENLRHVSHSTNVKNSGYTRRVMRQRGVRDRFIMEKHKKGFSVPEILMLLEMEGFRPVSRIRVHQIIEKAGLKKRT